MIPFSPLVIETKNGLLLLDIRLSHNTSFDNDNLRCKWQRKANEFPCVLENNGKSCSIFQSLKTHVKCEKPKNVFKNSWNIKKTKNPLKCCNIPLTIRLLLELRKTGNMIMLRIIHSVSSLESKIFWKSYIQSVMESLSNTPKLRGRAGWITLAKTLNNVHYPLNLKGFSP